MLCACVMCVLALISTHQTTNHEFIVLYFILFIFLFICILFSIVQNYTAYLHPITNDIDIGGKRVHYFLCLMGRNLMPWKRIAGIGEKNTKSICNNVATSLFTIFRYSGALRNDPAFLAYSRIP